MTENPKILFVDDSDDFREVMVSFFQIQGYTVFEADNGEDGFNVAKREKPDIVILDLMMPKKDGITVCKELRADEDLKNVPIVILTAKDDLTNKTKGMNAGANDFIAKPCSMRELLTRVASQMKAKKLLVINLTYQDDIPILTVNGDLTIETSVALKRKYEELIAGGYKNFVIDLIRLQGISSTGIRELLSLLKKSNSLNGDTRFCNLKPAVTKEFRASGLINLFKIYVTAKDAVNSYK